MDNSAFMLTLTSEDWDRNLGGWRCPALKIPGAKIESIFEAGNKIDSSWYEVLINQQIIRWSRAELPEKIAVSITLRVCS